MGCSNKQSYFSAAFFRPGRERSVRAAAPPTPPPPPPPPPRAANARTRAVRCPRAALSRHRSRARATVSAAHFGGSYSFGQLLEQAGGLGFRLTHPVTTSGSQTSKEND